MQDPRYMHEYLDRAQSRLAIIEGNGDESDKHLESLDRKYSCLISLGNGIHCNIWSNHTIEIQSFSTAISSVLM